MDTLAVSAEVLKAVEVVWKKIKLRTRYEKLGAWDKQDRGRAVERKSGNR